MDLLRLMRILHILTDKSLRAQDQVSNSAHLGRPTNPAWIGADPITIAATLAAVEVIRRSGHNECKIEYIESELGATKRLRLTQRIRELQQYFNCVFIEFGATTAPARLGPSTRDSALVQRLEQILLNYVDNEYAPRTEIVMIGVGSALAPGFVTAVVDRVRLQQPNFNFAVKVLTGLPQTVRSAANSGSIDLGVTSFSEDDRRKYRRQLVEDELVMHLVIERHHPKATKAKCDGIESLHISPNSTFFEDMILVLPNDSRSPTFPFPVQDLPKSTTVEYVDTWHEAITMVLCKGDVCAGVFPQIFPDWVRGEFFEIPLHGHLPKMRLGVLRPEVAALRCGRAKTRIVDALREEFVKEIQDLSRERVSKLVGLFPERLSKTAHVSRVDGGKRRWLRGDLVNRVITPSGHIRAEHVFQADESDQPQQCFTIDGRGTVDDDSTVHIVWRADDIRKRSAAYLETYTVAITATGRTDGYDAMVGMWSGWATWTKQKDPDIGYFIIYDVNSATLTDDDLDALIVQHQKSVQTEKPELLTVGHQKAEVLTKQAPRKNSKP